MKHTSGGKKARTPPRPGLAGSGMSRIATRGQGEDRSCCGVGWGGTGLGEVPDSQEQLHNSRGPGQNPSAGPLFRIDRASPDSDSGALHLSVALLSAAPCECRGRTPLKPALLPGFCPRCLGKVGQLPVKEESRSLIRAEWGNRKWGVLFETLRFTSRRMALGPALRSEVGATRSTGGTKFGVAFSTST